jgi:hypothetical protein
MLDQKPIAYGRTAEVYAWENGLVLKLFYDWVSPQAVEYEANIHRTVQAYFDKLPRLIEQINLNGRQGILFERVNGVSFSNLIFANIFRLPAQFRLLANLHHQLHKVEMEGLPQLKARLPRDINAVDCLSTEEKNRVLTILAELPDQKILCHFDFHPGQIMITADGPVVIDWVDACLGDPTADVARSMVLFKFSSSNEPGWVKNIFGTVLGNWAARVYLNEILRLKPELTKAQITRWMIPVATARLRERVPGFDKKALPWLRKQLRSG